jgi:hypothetical protein
MLLDQRTAHGPCTPARFGSGPSAAKHSAEKLHPGTSGAKALTQTKGFIAAFKTLRHPKSEFSANCKAGADVAALYGTT